MTLKLHEHQTEAITAIEREFASGKRRTLAVLATGAGKTIIYLSLVDRWSAAGKRILILAHRRELIHQPVDRAEQFFPDLYRRMGIVMGQEDDSEAQVVVATVQTASRDKKRLEKMGQFDYVILDECHHGTALSYLKLMEQYPNSKWLGLTATPFRSDGESMAKIFDSLAFRYPITAAIEGGTLVPFDAYGFTLPISIEGVAETMDGWEEKALGTLLSADNAIQVVYEKWLQYCVDRRTICFTASVAQAHATAAYFKARGVEAAAVDGSTPKKVRDRILSQFRAGRLQVVSNCQVWTEGVDVPEASAALMVCPTKSDLAYVQKLGRVLRTFPGKKDAIILDFAPLDERNIIMAGDVLGVPRVVEKAEAKAKKAGIMVRAARVDDFGTAVTVDPSTLIVEALTYLRKGNLAWSLMGNLAVASLSDVSMLAIEMPSVNRLAKAEVLRSDTDKWTAPMERLYQSLLKFRVWVCTKEGQGWMARFDGAFSTMDKAMAATDDLPGVAYQAGLAKRKKKWRSRPVSMPQVNYLLRLGLKVPDGCTSGQAAQMISHELASRALAKTRPSLETEIMAKEEVK